MDGAEPDADADAGGAGGEVTAPARFTEDLVLEIMSHLPARSLYRFKCVSRQWLGLISDIIHRARMSQTLAGFFYIGYNMRQRAALRNALHFTSARPDDDDGPPPLIDPSALSLPPAARRNLHRVDCSNGLILLRCWNATPEDGFSLTVCNPATDEWAAVPDSPTRGVGTYARLAVHPTAVSPFRYFVFQFRAGSGPVSRGRVVSAEIYSSESGEWTYRELGWDEFEAGVSLRDETSGVFFGGMLHLAPLEPVIVSVDGGGNTWKTIPKPSHPADDDNDFGVQAPGFIGVSQGRLHFLNTREYDHLTLCDWELDDGGGWVMKHCVSLRELSAGRWDFGEGFKYSVIAIHPDCNIVYMLQKQNNTLLSYDMNRGEGCVIRDLGLDNFVPYLPYVPRFATPLTIRGSEN